MRQLRTVAICSELRLSEVIRGIFQLPVRQLRTAAICSELRLSEVIRGIFPATCETAKNCGNLQ